MGKRGRLSLSRNSPTTFEELLWAESKGGYFNSRIWNRFAYAKAYSARAQPQIRDSYAIGKTEN